MLRKMIVSLSASGSSTSTETAARVTPTNCSTSNSSVSTRSGAIPRRPAATVRVNFTARRPAPSAGKGTGIFRRIAHAREEVVTVTFSRSLSTHASAQNGHVRTDESRALTFSCLLAAPTFDGEGEPLCLKRSCAASSNCPNK